MKLFVKLGSLVLLTSVGFYSFAGGSPSHQFNLTIANTILGAGALSAPNSSITVSPNSGGIKAFRCTSNGALVSCTIIPSYINSTLSFNIDYLGSSNVTPSEVGTLSYTTEAGSNLDVSFAPKSGVAGVVCGYSGPASIPDSGLAATTNLTCSPTTPWSPVGPSYSPFSYSVALTGNASYKLTNSASSSVPASWGSTSNEDNVMGNVMKLVLSDSQYNLTYNAIASALSGTDFDETAKFNLVFAPSTQGTSVSIPVTFIDNAGDYSLTPATFNLDTNTVCSVSNPVSGSTKFPVNCVYKSPVKNYTYVVDIASTKVGDATLAFGKASLLAGYPSWAQGLTPPSSSKAPYTISFSASDATYSNDSGDFNLHIPVSIATSAATASPIANQINLDIKKTAGSVDPAATTTSGFYLETDNDATRYLCSMPAATATAGANNTYTLNLKPSCAVDPSHTTYTYKIDFSGLPSGYKVESSGATLTATGGLSAFQKVLTKSGDNSSLNVILTNPGASFTSADSGSIEIKVPVTNGSNTADAYIYLNKTATGSVLESDQSAVILDPATQSACSWTSGNVSDNGTLKATCASSGVKVPNAYNLKFAFGGFTYSVDAQPSLIGALPTWWKSSGATVTGKIDGRKAYNVSFYIPNFSSSFSSGSFEMEVPVSYYTSVTGTGVPHSAKIPVHITAGNGSIVVHGGRYALTGSADSSVCTWSGTTISATTPNVPSINISCTNPVTWKATTFHFYNNYGNNHNIQFTSVEFEMGPNAGVNLLAGHPITVKENQTTSALPSLKYGVNIDSAHPVHIKMTYDNTPRDFDLKYSSSEKKYIISNTYDGDIIYKSSTCGLFTTECKLAYV